MSEQKQDMQYIFHIRVENQKEVSAQISGPGSKPKSGSLAGALLYDEDTGKNIRMLQAKAVKGELNTNIEGEALGEALFNVLFSEKLRAGFFKHHEKARKAGAALYLELDINEQEAPDLADLPWEFMRVPADSGAPIFWLATAPDIIFSRRRSSWDVMKLRQLNQDEALRIALVVSAPMNFPVVEYQAVKETLQTLAASSGRRIKLLEPIGPENAATPVAIENLLRKEPHVFHFIGHGRIRLGGNDEQPDTAQIALQDGYGAARWHQAEYLAKLFRRRVPGVVLLQSSESATLPSWFAFNRAAPQLVDQNIPIVIAMQYKISISSANRFAVEFYQQLAAGAPVGHAVQESRRILSLAMFDDDPREFPAPVLFTRALQGSFFRTPSEDEPSLGGETPASTAGETETGGSPVNNG